MSDLDLKRTLKSVAVLALCAGAIVLGLRTPQPLRFDSRPLPPIHVSQVSSSPERLSFSLRPVVGSSVAVTVSGRDFACGRPRSRVACLLPPGYAERPFTVTVVK